MNKFFSSAILLSSALLFNHAHAQKYVPVTVEASQALIQPMVGKPSVIEFFWYGCSHCYHMEPLVKKLSKDRKDDFILKRYPVVLPGWESGAKLFFTLEQMGLADKLHDSVFATIQKDRKNIMDKKDLRDSFLKSHGVDINRFDNIYNSFGMNTKMNKAKNYVAIYKINSSPSFVINNSYTVSPSITGGYDATISSINHILNTVKK